MESNSDTMKAYLILKFMSPGLFLNKTPILSYFFILLSHTANYIFSFHNIFFSFFYKDYNFYNSTNTLIGTTQQSRI